MNALFNLETTRLLTTDLTTVSVWDTATGKSIFQTPSSDDPIDWADFSRDGSRLAAISRGGIVQVLDGNTGEPQLSFSAGPADCGYTMIFGKDANQLIVSSACGEVSFWDLASGEAQETLRKEFSLGGGSVYTSITSDGTRAVISGVTQQIETWDVAASQKLEAFSSGEQPIYYGSLSPDDRLFAATAADGSFKIWEMVPRGEKQVFTVSAGLRVARSAYSADGKRLAVLSTSSASDYGEIRIYDTVSGTLLRNIQEYRICCSLAFSPDGKYLVSAADGGFRVWESDSESPSEVINVHNGVVLKFAFNRQGNLLATAGREGNLKVWDFASRQLLQTINLEEGAYAYDVKFSPDGKTLATASFMPLQGSGKIELWDVTSGEPLFSLGEGLDGNLAVWTVDFSPNGKQLAGGYSDNTARVWDVSEMQPQAQPAFILRGHSDSIWTLAYSPDGSRLATASLDYTAKLWDVTPGANQGQLLATYPGHTAAVSDVTFSPDGFYLSAASWDGTVRVYFTQLKDLIATARERTIRSLTAEECQQYLHLEACSPAP
jgi:WD40 repeat protein